MTNPPFSLKEPFLARAYSLGKPFAFLMPVTALGGKGRQALYKQHGIELLLLDQRINFITPNKKADGRSWFFVAWFTHGLNLGSALAYASLPTLKHSQTTPQQKLSLE